MVNNGQHSLKWSKTVKKEEEKKVKLVKKSPKRDKIGQKLSIWADTVFKKMVKRGQK